MPPTPSSKKPTQTTEKVMVPGVGERTVWKKPGDRAKYICKKSASGKQRLVPLSSAAKKSKKCQKGKGQQIGGAGPMMDRCKCNEKINNDCKLCGPGQFCMNEKCELDYL